MIRKYHIHTHQTNPRHREDDQQNTDILKTPGRQFKYSNQLSFFPIKIIAKLERITSTV